MDSKALCLDWTKHIKDPDKKQDFEVTVRNSTTALRRLYELLEEEEQSLSVSKEEDYSVPNWAYLMADRQGQLRAIRRMKARLAFICPPGAR